MNILFDIGHPGQVHLFKYVIKELKNRNHNIVITAKEIPTVVELLKRLDMPYISLGKKFDSILLKGLSQLNYDLKLSMILRKFNIDIAAGSSITITHSSFFNKAKALVLDDDDAEAVKLFSYFAHPFADCIISPDALAHQRNNKKGITYKGTHELFYLHPEYFTPDINVVKDVGIDIERPFFILRFVSGKAYHDSGEKWMTMEQKIRLINLISEFGNVYITTERKIEPELEKWQLKIPPEKIHHLIYFASMFIGDSQTMTSEAAILGTPAVKCNTFAHKLSIPNMLEEKYCLCYSYQPFEFDAMCFKIKDLIKSGTLREEWSQRRKLFLSDSINPTAFLVWFIEKYPESQRIMKKDPDYQYNFR